MNSQICVQIIMSKIKYKINQNKSQFLIQYIFNYLYMNIENIQNCHVHIYTYSLYSSYPLTVYNYICKFRCVILILRNNRPTNKVSDATINISRQMYIVISVCYNIENKMLHMYKYNICRKYQHCYFDIHITDTF